MPTSFLALLALLVPATIGAQPTTRAAAAAADTGAIVLMISLDGFRHDYLDRATGPGFARLQREGARGDLIPSYPSKTFPNHLTLVTGLRPQHHGIVANRFYDPARDASYAIADTVAVRDGSWYRGEPLWVAAERQGVRAASYFWPGSEAAIGGVRPGIFKPFADTVPLAVRVDTVLAWLALPPARRPRLITMYASPTDHAGHDHGPESPEVDAAIAELDGMFTRLLAGIDASPLNDRIHLLVVADHGMATTRTRQYVSLDSVIDLQGVRVADGGPGANLHVAGGTLRAATLRDSINRRIAVGRAYLRADVPGPLHYRDDPRIGDLVVVMDLPWQVGARPARRTEGGAAPLTGAHGWDPAERDMHATFLYRPPRPVAGMPARLGAIDNVDVAPFVAELLGIRPPTPLDGTPGAVARRIRGAGTASPTSPTAPPLAPRPPARPADVGSVDAIMAAVYDVISGPAGQRRDWDRFRSLFLSGARLIPTGRALDGVHTLQAWDVETYIRTAGPRLEEGGFFERELGRVTERFGDVVHLMSSYDSRRRPEDPAPFARGVNSFQLWFDGTRWWVVTILWQAERADQPIPGRYLRAP